MNSKHRTPAFALVLVILQIISRGESTPYVVKGPLSNTSIVNSVNIEGCKKDWCVLIEEKNIPIEINITTPAGGLTGSYVDYEIRSEDGVDLYSAVSMPEFCYQTYPRCPLEGNRNAVYSTVFWITDVSNSFWDFFKSQKPAILKITFYTDDFMYRTLFYIDIKIVLKREGCFVFCVD